MLRDQGGGGSRACCWRQEGAGERRQREGAGAQLGLAPGRRSEPLAAGFHLPLMICTGFPSRMSLSSWMPKVGRSLAAPASTQQAASRSSARAAIRALIAPNRRTVGQGGLKTRRLMLLGPQACSYPRRTGAKRF